MFFWKILCNAIKQRKEKIKKDWKETHKIVIHRCHGCLFRKHLEFDQKKPKKQKTLVESVNNYSKVSGYKISMSIAFL